VIVIVPGTRTGSVMIVAEVSASGAT